MKLTEQTLNAILNYLVEQPFKEVAGLIQAIQQDLQVKDETITESAE